VEKTLRDKLPDTFEQLSTPLMVTATDVQSGELVVLRSGPLVAALRASSALPGLISPTKLTGRTLIDGGVLNNLPVDIIQTMTLAPVVAVDVTPSADRSIDFGEDATLWERIASTWQSKQRPLVIEVLVKASEITQNVLTDLRLAMYPPKLYIRVPLDTNFKVEDFGRLNEAVEVGYRATLETLKEASW
jgi:NTE family protein